MLTYKKSGVDKKKGYHMVEKIKKETIQTYHKNVLSPIGGFGALYQLGKDYKDPILVSGTDGVGTKLLLALEYKAYEAIGIDCFAMCANDILCHGAKPLFFLDYLACGKLNTSIAYEIIKGIIKACQQTSTALIGGETAEMPGMYKVGHYDIAGFCLGVVEKENLIDGSKIEKGDIILGIPSSGIHSNGFSLIRKIFSRKEFSAPFNKEPLYKHLLAPTKLYHLSIEETLLKNNLIKAMAHITGGGLYENIPRMIPDGLCAVVEKKKIPPHELFHLIEKKGAISNKEMWNTFNMGIGMVIIIKEKEMDHVLKTFSLKQEDPLIIGYVEEGKNKFILK